MAEESIPTNGTPAPAAAGTITREEFGATQALVQAETASAAVAEQAKAMIQARYVMADRRPRDWDLVRTRILKECQRPNFAVVARYSKPMGGKRAEGPSIRFAEAAMRCMGNVANDTMTVWDDPEKRIVRVVYTDLETNIAYSKDITVQKTVERRSVKTGTPILSKRMNSNGEWVYLVPATDDDLLNKENALISKAMRTCALRLLPGDILDDAMRQVVDTLRNKAAKDPEAERKAILDTFSRLGVSPTDLKAYVGHEMTRLTPEEITDLSAIAHAIRDGETSWAEVLSEGGPKPEPPAPQGGGESPAPQPPKAQAKPADLAGLTQQLKERTGKGSTAEEPPEDSIPPIGDDFAPSSPGRQQR